MALFGVSYELADQVDLRSTKGIIKQTRRQHQSASSFDHLIRLQCECEGRPAACERDRITPDEKLWTHPLVLEPADTQLDLIIGKHRDLLYIMIMRGYGPQAKQYENRNRNQLFFTPSPISQSQRREATHRPKPSTRPERTTARTTRCTPTCGPSRGSWRMKSWKGGNCSRLSVFRFNVGIRRWCLCSRRHLSICRICRICICRHLDQVRRGKER